MRLEATAPAADPAGAYEAYQAWPEETASAAAACLHAAVRRPPPRRCLFLGTATGVNDVLPFARRADPADRIVAGDIVPACLDRLRERAAREGLRNVEVRVLDVRRDLEGQGTFDLVTLFFVIHRIAEWRAVAAPLAGCVAEGGSLFVTEFAGPGGILYLSNERGGTGQDPVSRLIRRYFELLPEPFAPPLKSTWIGPFRELLARFLRSAETRDVVWPQRLTVGDMYARIAARAYAPYFGTRASPALLERLRTEFAPEWEREVAFQEKIRLYRFVRP
jgi:predicted O-methyltransferase YrrM